MRYAFASREWFAAVHGIITQRASSLAAAGINDRIGFCEIYRDVPPSLGWGTDQIAYSIVYEAGEVDMRLSERDDVQFKASGTWAAFAEASAFVIGGDRQRWKQYLALTSAMVKDGRIEILIGSGLKEPGDLEYLHDVISRITEHDPAL